MIKIFFYKEKKEKNIIKIKIIGHSNFKNKNGNDLVCAAITAISTGILNAIDKLNKNTCIFDINKNGLIIIKVIKNNKKLQFIFKIFFYQLKTIYLQYKKNINLKEVYI